MSKVIPPKCKMFPPVKSLSTSPPSSSGNSSTVKTLLRHLIATNLLPSSKKSPLYRCPYCTKILGRSKFPVHLCCLHSDKLLSSYFPPSSPPPSEEICRQVLRTRVVDLSKKLPSKTKRIRSGCHICGLSYSKNNQLKYHFLVNHTDKLCEEISNFSNDSQIFPTPQKFPTSVNHLINIGDMSEQLIKSNTKITHNKVKPVKIKRLKKSEKSKFCASCGKSVVDNAKMRRHQANQHPDQLFLECQPSGMGDSQFREFCKEYFKMEVRKATYNKSGDKIYKCGYCPPGRETSYKGHDYLIVHLAYQHRRDMEGKLKQDGEVDSDKLEEIDNADYCFGDDEDVEVEVMEEDASEFDMKPMVDKKMWMFNELIINEDDDNDDEDAKLDHLGQLYGLPEKQAVSQEIIKMEVCTSNDYDFL